MAFVAAAPAEVGGVDERAFEHEQLVEEIAAGSESDLVAAPDRIAAGDLGTDTAALLVDEWLPLADLSPGDLKDEIAVCIDLQRVDARVTGTDRARVGTGCH